MVKDHSAGDKMGSKWDQSGIVGVALERLVVAMSPGNWVEKICTGPFKKDKQALFNFLEVPHGTFSRTRSNVRKYHRYFWKIK